MRDAPLECHACRRRNPAGARFCNGCGARLARRCGACAHENPPDASFCSACGMRLDGASEPGAEVPEPRSYTPSHLAERILRQRAALEGERKHVTVLFCDLADSTRVAERLGPEAMHEILDRCFQLILGQVHRFEGTVNQFLGDGVMALFGAPVALEDAPRRAVTAALAIQRALEPLSEEVDRRWGVAFQMRIGIHAGPVVVGRIGDDLRMDYTAVGDTTNLAKRLQELAIPGSVLVSEAVENLVSGWFEREDLGALGVKGRSEPVRAFRVVAERRVGGRVEARAESGLTPLVGRDRELDALLRAFDDAASGRGRVVFLVGEAGIGKSRLLYELRRRLAGRPHRFVDGRCASYAQNAPFHCIVDSLRRGFGIDDRDDDATALGRLDAFEGGVGGGLEWTLPFVRRLLSLPAGDAEVDAMDAPTRRSETFRALLARIQRAADLSPFVLVIEDLHWIDRTSEELLSYLSDSIATSRLLLLLTHRPGYQHPFGDRSYHARLTLQPLSEQEMERMAGAALEATELPPALRSLIARKAEGNPFFVEEVVRSLLEDGSLRRVDGRVELTRPVEHIQVPDSIQGVLMARLDRLDEAPKRALQMASVIGREFAVRLLERIAEVGERLGPVIDELRGLELIYEKAAHPELAFMFKHALTHDVAYESVLVSRRRGLHRVVGAAIEELYHDRLGEHFEALAHHYGEAQEWEKALQYSHLAARKAAAAFANDAAALHARRALEIAGRLTEAPRELRLELEELLGGALLSLSQFEASGEAFQRASVLAEEAETSALELGRAAHSFFWGHLYERMDEALREGERLSEARGLVDGSAVARLVRCFHDEVHGRLAGADEELTSIEATSPRAPENLILLHYLRGQTAEWEGRWQDAAAIQRAGIEIARKHRMPGYLIPGQWFYAKALCCLGRYAEALSELREAYELAARIGDRAHRTRMLNTLGWIHGELGCDDRAAELNRSSVALADEMMELGLVAGTPELRGNAQVNLACNRLAEGDLAGAGELLAAVREEVETPGDEWMRWRYGLHLLDAEARLALATGEPERAAALLASEWEGARASRSRKLEARALALRGCAFLHVDRRDEAEASLREALALAEGLGHPPVRWRVLALLGELAARRGEGAEGARLRARARALAEGFAPGVPEELRGGLRRLAASLESDPLSACR